MDFFSPELAHWLRPPDRDNPPLYLVGGTVRDFLMRRPAKDFDLVCHDAANVAARIARNHNAALIPFAKKADAPCYRVVSRQHPERILDIAPLQGDGIAADLGRRDFCINAMALEVIPPEGFGPLIDPFDGQKDIQRRQVRMVTPEALDADPLRMLRAFRFAATLGFDIHAATLEAVQARAGTITNVAGERILTELLLLLATDRAADHLAQMDAVGLLQALFPEIIPMHGCTQNGFHHLDVWEHCLATQRACEEIIDRPVDFFGTVGDAVRRNLGDGNRLALLKLAALLHDMGKPAHRHLNPATGRICFYQHAETGARRMEAIAGRLRMSGRDREYVVRLVAEHMQVPALSRPEVTRKARLRWFRKMAEDVMPLLIHGLADMLSTRGPDSSDAQRRAFTDWVGATALEYLQTVQSVLSRPDLVNGADLKALGMPPGPAMGRLLRDLREAQDLGRVQDRDAALELARNSM
jgi:poly(A) polymerase